MKQELFLHRVMPEEDWKVFKKECEDAPDTEFALFVRNSLNYCFFDRLGRQMDKWEAFSLQPDFWKIFHGNTKIIAVGKDKLK